jgi:predicted permease
MPSPRNAAVVSTLSLVAFRFAKAAASSVPDASAVHILDVALIILPVFGLIGLGYLAGRTGLLSKTVGDGLTEFVATVGIPMMIFRTMATAHFPDLSPWPLWGTYFGGAIVSWALGSMLATRVFGRSRAAGVIAGTSASFGNLAMVGIPLIVSAYGENGAVPLFIIISVHLPTMMVAGTLMTERAVRIDAGSDEPVHVMRALKAIGRNMLFNPLVWGLFLGAAWRFFQIPLVGPVKTVVDQVAAAGLPTALISLGMAMNRYGLVGELKLSAVLTGLKLGVMPAAVWLLGTYVFGLTPAWTTVATIAAACPSGVNAYLFAQRFNVAHGLASNSIALTTLVCVGTTLVWLMLVG